MRIEFLGVGEACDPVHPNTSLLVRSVISGKERVMLLDCGFNAAHQFFRVCSDQDMLDALWISHFHGDHFFGVPLLLLRFQEMNRTKTLEIIGQPGVRKKVFDAMDLAYPNFREKLQFRIEFREIEPGGQVIVYDFSVSAAENEHSLRSLSVRIEDGERALFYSGDGRPTEATLELARECDLIVHEAFRMSGKTSGHGTIAGSIEFAQNAGVMNLALVHVERHDREEHRHEIREMLLNTKGLNVFLPVAWDVVKI
ncbi:MAG: ribonuclease Z [Thermodesulfobacteriota bacterium]|nr:ribonuclease Z [Thermodesulfobacteriota bacterium]